MLRNRYIYYGIIMRTVLYLALIATLLVPGSGHGQSVSAWLDMGQPTTERSQEDLRQLEKFVESMRDDAPASARQLSKVFRKVHATYLKKYEAYADFPALFTDGTYDCLTATALFSHVLSALGYDYRIIETNYHIFILVQSTEGEVLLETTDRASGFVTDPATIEKRTQGYRLLEASAPMKGQVSYQYRCDIFREVSPDQLSGLLLFNQAVKAYNRGDWLSSARFLESSFAFQESERADELGDLLIRTVVVRKDVSQDLRRACMEHLMPFVIRRSGRVAIQSATD